MTEKSIDDLRLDLVGIRAELRSARQDLTRKKYVIRRTTILHARTAREREQELEQVICEAAEIIKLEDEVLNLQHAEDLVSTQIEIGLRPSREYEWQVRELQADAQNNLATAIASCPNCLQSLSIVRATGEDGPFNGTSRYLAERAI